MFLQVIINLRHGTSVPMKHNMMRHGQTIPILRNCITFYILYSHPVESRVLVLRTDSSKLNFILFIQCNFSLSYIYLTNQCTLIILYYTIQFTTKLVRHVSNPYFGVIIRDFDCNLCNSLPEPWHGLKEAPHFVSTHIQNIHNKLHATKVIYNQQVALFTVLRTKIEPKR
jgi:hypothetical protein